MIKAQSIIGKPVLSRADGEKLDSVKDIIIGKDHISVIALLISEGGLFSKPTVVPVQSVVSFGKDAVVITDSQAAVRADHVPEVAQALELDEKLGGKTVFSETGDQHGKLADIYFDEKTGKITGVDVTDLGPGPASKNVAYLDMSDVISFGADAVVISAGAISKLQAAGSPVQGDATKSATDAISTPAVAPPIEPGTPAAGPTGSTSLTEATALSTADDSTSDPTMPGYQAIKGRVKSTDTLPDDTEAGTGSAGSAND